jgi:hypothetical protein
VHWQPEARAWGHLGCSASYYYYSRCQCQCSELELIETLALTVKHPPSGTNVSHCRWQAQAQPEVAQADSKLQPETELPATGRLPLSVLVLVPVLNSRLSLRKLTRTWRLKVSNSSMLPLALPRLTDRHGLAWPGHGQAVALARMFRSRHLQNSGCIALTDTSTTRRSNDSDTDELECSRADWSSGPWYVITLNFHCSSSIRSLSVLPPALQLEALRRGIVKAMAADVHTSLAVATPFYLSILFQLHTPFWLKLGTGLASVSVWPMAKAGGQTENQCLTLTPRPEH